MANTLSDFISMAEALAGLPPGGLKERAPGLGHCAFRALVERADDRLVEPLLSRHRALKTQGASAESAARSLLGDPALKAIARSVLKLLYLGVWYPPSLSAGAGGSPTVVSIEAHRTALVWRVIGAPPIGLGEAAFGRWVSAPGLIAEDEPNE